MSLTDAILRGRFEERFGLYDEEVKLVHRERATGFHEIFFCFREKHWEINVRDSDLKLGISDFSKKFIEPYAEYAWAIKRLEITK